MSFQFEQIATADLKKKQPLDKDIRYHKMVMERCYFFQLLQDIGSNSICSRSLPILLLRIQCVLVAVSKVQNF